MRKRSRLVSIPFMNVPAAARLRSRSDQNIYSRTNQDVYGWQVSKSERSSRHGEIREPHFEHSSYGIGIRSILYDSHQIYRTSVEEEQYSSSGLGSVSVDGSVFNSPTSSHFYFSPDIFMQKPWLIDQSIDIPGHIYNLPNIKSQLSIDYKNALSSRTKSGSKLSYLSPLAPDYIQRNLSMNSKLTNLYSSIYSLGPSSFHSSRCYGDCVENSAMPSYSNESHASSLGYQSTIEDTYGKRTRKLSNAKTVVTGLESDRRSSEASKTQMTSLAHERKLVDFNPPRLISNQINDGNKGSNVPNKKTMKKVEDLMKNKLVVSKIEKFSRILFPLTFILFNFFYWPYIYSRS